MSATTQPTTMPTITAPDRRAGRTAGACWRVQAISTMASETKAIQGTSHIWNAGRIEMKAIEMPASVPSIAARGVYVPDRRPDEGAEQHDDADDEGPGEAGLPRASTGPWSVRYTGSMITKTTMNMCGTLGPYGIAVTSVRPSFFAELPGEVRVEEVAERQRDAQRRQDAAEDGVGRQLHHAEAPGR